VVGVDCFTDNYPRVHKQANLLPAREHGDFTFVNADLVTADVEGLLDGCDTAFRRFCEAAGSRAPIEIYGDGRQTRDFTFVGDVVAAVLAAGEADGVGGEIYNIGGGSRASLAATLELLAAIAGRPLDVRHEERESGDVQDTGAAIDRARATLGFEPATELRDGLQAEFEWVLERAQSVGRLRSGVL
jgi:UDP-glucose 4-epimerase